MGNLFNIRDISIRCGRCNQYQTLSGFGQRGDWHVYTYECENGKCDPDVTRTLVEVPKALDLFYRKHPDCPVEAPDDPQPS